MLPLTALTQVNAITSKQNYLTLYRNFQKSTFFWICFSGLQKCDHAKIFNRSRPRCESFFCFTAPWFLNWMLILRTHNLFINHENILFKICKVKTYCFLRLNVHSWISLEYLPWNCRYHLLKEVVYIVVVWQPLSSEFMG